MQKNLPDQTELCRRTFLGHGTSALGAAALASLLWFYGLGFGAARWSRFLTRPNTWRVVDIGIGLMMLALAASLGHWAWSSSD